MTTISQNSKLPEQIQIPKIEKNFTALSGLCNLLQKLYSQNG